jgi:glycosyltransferase involved in cell wall biosynthesis
MLGKKKMKHITVVMTGYNSAEWIRKSIESALTQNYPKDNFDIICMDAETNDGTYEILKEYEKSHSNVTVVRNNPRQYQVQNIKDAVAMAKDDSIIVSLDFDDWLNGPHVFNKVNEVYSNDDVWMTYGTYVEYPHRDVSYHYRQYPDEVIDANSFRKYPLWLSSHLRTWKKELFQKIKDEDLRDVHGNYCNMAGDTVILYPMLEMSGHNAMYIKDHLYVYNKTNDLSEDKVNVNHQAGIAGYIKSKPPYTRLERL